MAGTHGFFWQLAIVLIGSAFFGLTLWQRIKRPKTLSFLVPLGFGLVFTMFLLIFVRQASSIYHLQHLRGESVSSISYKGEMYRSPGQINVIVGALNESQWWSARSSAMVEHESFAVHFTDGTDWAMFIGRNRYGSGIIIELADEHEFSRGYAFNPALGEVLKDIDPGGESTISK
jgi:hypothetical protein